MTGVKKHLTQASDPFLNAELGHNNLGLSMESPTMLAPQSTSPRGNKASIRYPKNLARPRLATCNYEVSCPVNTSCSRMSGGLFIQ